MTDNAPLLYRIREVAEQLGVSRSRAYELAGSGEIESVRIGSSLRVPREALVEYVEGLRGTPAEKVVHVDTTSGHIQEFTEKAKAHAWGSS